MPAGHANSYHFAGATFLKKQFKRRIQKISGAEHVQSSPEDLVCYGYDATAETAAPDLVVHPGSTEEVVAIIREAAREGIPLVPRGAGTGLSGGALASQGGILLHFSRMNQIEELDNENMIAVVQPGVINWDMKRAAAMTGLFYPPDPSSTRFCTLGGNIAEDASGPYGARYGATGDYVLGLEAVLASGEVIRTGSRARRDVAGYDLNSLLVGSEGTLAVITGATLRLIAAPRSRAASFIAFEVFEKAAEAVAAIRSAVPETAALEIMDQVTLECINHYLPGRLPIAGAMLLLELHGETACVKELLEEVVTAAEKNDGRVIITAEDDDCEELWGWRRAVSPSLGRITASKIGEDVSVPVGMIGLMHERVRAISDKYSLGIALFGHAGDGNLHPNILTDRRDPHKMKLARAAIGELFDAAIDLGGTISGEHGIGTAKSAYMTKGRDSQSIKLMKGIKKLLDPGNILNPGKIFP